MYDQMEPVERYGRDSYRRDEHVSAGHHGNQLTERLTQVPRRYGNLPFPWQRQQQQQ